MAIGKTYIRLEGSRDITDDLVLDTGLVYDLTFARKVYLIEQDISATSTPNWSSKSFTQTGSAVSVTLSYAPSSTYPVIVYFYLFLTDSTVAYEKLDITTGDVVEWLPLLLDSPSKTQDIGNAIEGKLSVSISDFTFINDKSIFDLIDDKTSFYNKTAKVWSNFGGSSIESFFQVKIAAFVVQTKTIKVSMRDNLHMLNSTFTMDDDNDENYFTEFETKGKNRPVPFFWGRSSPYKSASSTAGSTRAIGLAAPVYDKENAIKCIPRWGIAGASASIWWVCRTDGFNTANISFTPISNPIGATWATITVADDDLCRVFCGQKQAQAVFADASSWTVDVEILDIDAGTVRISYGSAFTAALSTFAMKRQVFLFTDHPDFDDGGAYWYASTWFNTPQATAGGNEIMTITNLHAPNVGNSGGLLYLDINRHDLYAVTANTTHYKSGTVLEQIANAHGLSVNSAGVTDLDTPTDNEVYMMVPARNKTTYPKVIDVLGDILRSNFAYMYVEDDGTLNCKRIDTDQTPTTTLTDSDIIADSIKIEYESRDIKVRLKTQNHLKYDLPSSFSMEETAIADVEKRLHGVDKTYDYINVIRNQGNATAYRLRQQSRPRIAVVLRLPASFRTINIGDKIKLVSVDLENFKSEYMMVTRVTKTVVFTEIKLTAIRYQS